jgi:hypothetical protein
MRARRPIRLTVSRTLSPDLTQRSAKLRRLRVQGSRVGPVVSAGLASTTDRRRACKRQLHKLTGRAVSTRVRVCSRRSPVRSRLAPLARTYVEIPGYRWSVGDATQRFPEIGHHDWASNAARNELRAAATHLGRCGSCATTDGCAYPRNPPRAGCRLRQGAVGRHGRQFGSPGCQSSR